MLPQQQLAIPTPPPPTAPHEATRSGAGPRLSPSLQEASVLFASDNHRQFGEILITFLRLADSSPATGIVCKTPPRPLPTRLWQRRPPSSASQPGRREQSSGLLLANGSHRRPRRSRLSHRDTRRGTALARPFPGEHVRPALASAALVRAKSVFKNWSHQSSRSHNGALKVELEFCACKPTCFAARTTVTDKKSCFSSSHPFFC